VQTDSEVAVTRFGSGGGFSNIYAIPSYQSNAVNGYLTNHKPPYTSYSATYDQGISAGGGVYNRNGRGYPDVSVVGDNLVIFNRGTPVLIGGTSASVLLYGHLLSAVLMRSVWLLASQLWDLLIRLCMQTQGLCMILPLATAQGVILMGFTLLRDGIR
jgi:hypothetical protein